MELSSMYQPDTRVVSRSSLDDSGLSPWLTKVQRTILSPLNSLIMGKTHTIWWRRWGYNLAKRSDLNFSKERWALLQSFILKGKILDYYHKSWRGLGYVSTPVPSNSESKEYQSHDHFLSTSSWELNVSIDAIFNSLSVNMVSTSHLEDKDDEMIQSDTDPWIKHLNTLWDLFFE